ncbi:glutamate 5-kinase [Marinilabiliaceae bacterium JC017]|nr:glutamate 5-kinase [Marinilabiliaceae bacterium JC017]
MYNTITIKIGSNVLTSADGTLNRSRIEHLTEQIAALHHQGKKVILVSSGAVAAGRSLLHINPKSDPVSARQALSATGQVKLMSLYTELFEKKDVQIAQVLVTKEEFRTREHYLNMKNCVSALWDNNVLPVVNENDAVSVTALMFTDNDELAGLMSAMMNCNALYILSNIDGIYNGDPKLPDSRVIQDIHISDNSVSNYISSVKSDFGRGGMLTKCRIAQKTAASGIQVHIANGTRPNIIRDLTASPDEVVHTRFEAGESRPAIKKWMAYAEGFAKAEVTINNGAREALYGSKATSLLLAGLSWIKGNFKKGDLLLIKDESGVLIGIGRAKFDKEKAEKHRFDKKYKPLVHYDYLFLFPH